jgi:hypothetical protein
LDAISATTRLTLPPPATPIVDMSRVCRDTDTKLSSGGKHISGDQRTVRVRECPANDDVALDGDEVPPVRLLMPLVDRAVDRDIGGELVPAAFLVDGVAESETGSDRVLRV